MRPPVITYDDPSTLCECTQHLGLKGSEVDSERQATLGHPTLEMLEGTHRVVRSMKGLGMRTALLSTNSDVSSSCCMRIALSASFLKSISVYRPSVQKHHARLSPFEQTLLLQRTNVPPAKCEGA